MYLKLNLIEQPGRNITFQVQTSSNTNHEAVLLIPAQLNSVKSHLKELASDLIPSEAELKLAELVAKQQAIHEEIKTLRLEVFEEIKPSLTNLIDNYSSLYPEYLL